MAAMRDSAGVGGDRSALVLLLPGLGDAMVFSPCLDALARAGYAIDVVTMLGSIREYARALDVVRRVHHAPLLGEPKRAFGLLRAVRAERYDVTIVPFPAARFAYAAFAALTGARWVLMHDYGGISRTVLRARRAELVELRGGHRFFENVRLVQALGVKTISERYLVPEEWREAQPIPNVVGIHAGSMTYKGNENKRWPLEKFQQLIQRQLQLGRSVRLFVGPQEHADGEFLKERCPGLVLYATTLVEAARAICECSAFVANDSGVAHLAAGLGVPTIALFAMTDPLRVQPLGSSIGFRPTECPPCFDEGMQHFTCVRNIGYRCIRDDLRVDAVSQLVDRALAEGLPANAPLEASPFRLYGRLRGVAAPPAPSERAAAEPAAMPVAHPEG